MSLNDGGSVDASRGDSPASGDGDRLHAEYLMRRATYASVSIAGILILLKLYAWWSTGSVSILASLIDSTLDILASLITLLAVRHALQPADAEHRFGHGKLEALAGLGQSTFVVGSAGFLFLEAIGRLLHPQAIQMAGLGIIVMAFSVAATILLLAIQRHAIQHSGSTAIKADYLHYSADLLVNGSVIVALLLAANGWPGFDALFAGLIVVYILYSAWGIAHEAIEHLMDRELPDEDRGQIESIVRGHEAVRGLHDLRTRRSGRQLFIQLHLELDDDMSLMQAHLISDDVEARIRAAYPDAEVLIHEDPASLDEPRPEFDR